MCCRWFKCGNGIHVIKAGGRGAARVPVLLPCPGDIQPPVWDRGGGGYRDVQAAPRTHGEAEQQQKNLSFNSWIDLRICSDRGRQPPGRYEHGVSSIPTRNGAHPPLLENLQPFVKGRVKNGAAAPYEHIHPPPCKETGTRSAPPAPPTLAALPRVRSARTLEKYILFKFSFFHWGVFFSLFEYRLSGVSRFRPVCVRLSRVKSQPSNT